MSALDDLLRHKVLRTSDDSIAGKAAELILTVLAHAPRHNAGTYSSAAAILDTCRARSSGELRAIFDRWRPLMMMHCIELTWEAAEELVGRNDPPDPAGNPRMPRVRSQSLLVQKLLGRKP